MLEKYFLRRPVKDDIHQVLELMRRCDERDVGFADSDLEDIQDEWRICNPAQDAWLAINAQAQIQGYGAVIPCDSGRQLNIYDDPGTEQTDLFLGLLILCEKRAVNLIQEHAKAGQDLILTHAAESAEYQIKILEEAGYSLAQHVFNMHMDLGQDLPAAQMPADVTLRTAHQGQDEHQLFELIEGAFDWRERQSRTYEEWQVFMLQAENLDYDLWLLAEHEKQIIASCLGYAYDDMGWVRQLAVKKEWRGKGIGQALLLEAFNIFKQRGFAKAGLAVESSNPNACQFYERTGMTQAVHLMQFSKPVPIGSSS